MSGDLTKQMPSDDLRSILARLDRLEDKVDRRLQETRPIWERVLNELTELHTEINGVHTEISGVHSKVNEVHNEVNEVRNEVNGVRIEMREGFEKSRIELDKGMRLVARQIDVLNHDVLKVRADVRSLDERTTKLEGEPAE